MNDSLPGSLAPARERTGAFDALAMTFDAEASTVDLPVLLALQPALRASEERAITVAVHNGSAIIAVWPGYVDAAFGIAIDVGSTTIAGHLCDLATGEVVASAGVGCSLHLGSWI